MSPARREAARRAPVALPERDENLAIAGLLLDLAAVQDGERQRHAYTRAAYAVLASDRPMSERVNGGALEKIRYVGPSSERVIREALDSGTSPSVEAAIEQSGRARDVASRRALRSGFMSQAVAEQLLAAPLEGVIRLDDYRGDFQVHSTYSDGGQSLDEIVRASLALGQHCAAVTDHSYGLPVAGGMSMALAASQHAEIDDINDRYRGHFRLFKGIEANILPDGTLDLSEDERRQFEIVVAAPHSGLRAQADQTERMVVAVSQPHVHVLGHPRGRRFNTRAGIAADWRRVFAAAAENGVAVEIDGSIERQDLDAGLASQAIAAGCLIALDSDAHAPVELAFARMAIAHARLAGIPAARIVNCWSDGRIAEWCAGR